MTQDYNFIAFNLITFKIRQEICKSILLHNNNHFYQARMKTGQVYTKSWMDTKNLSWLSIRDGG